VPVPLYGYYASRLLYCANVTSLGECADKDWPPAPSGQEAAAASLLTAAAEAVAMGTDSCTDMKGHRGHDIKAHDLGPSVRPAPLIQDPRANVPYRRVRVQLRTTTAKSCCESCVEVNLNNTSLGGGKCGGWVWIQGGSNLCYLKDAGTGFSIRGGIHADNRQVRRRDCR